MERKAYSFGFDGRTMAAFRAAFLAQVNREDDATGAHASIPGREIPNGTFGCSCRSSSVRFRMRTCQRLTPATGNEQNGLLPIDP